MIKLNRHSKILKKDNTLYLIDYKSVVASYNFQYAYFKLGKNWNFSSTTLKSVYSFIDEFVEVPAIKKVKNEKEKEKYIKNLVQIDFIKVDTFLQNELNGIEIL